MGMYINFELSLRRCYELEGKDSNVVSIDLLDERRTRVLNFYRSFNSVGMTARNKKNCSLIEMCIKLVPLI